jgi:hypothetical protein
MDDQLIKNNSKIIIFEATIKRDKLLELLHKKINKYKEEAKDFLTEDQIDENIRNIYCVLDNKKKIKLLPQSLIIVYKILKKILKYNYLIISNQS